MVTIVLCSQLSSDIEPEFNCLIIQPDFTLLYFAYLRNLASDISYKMLWIPVIHCTGLGTYCQGLSATTVLQPLNGWFWRSSKPAALKWLRMWILRDLAIGQAGCHSPTLISSKKAEAWKELLSEYSDFEDELAGQSTGCCHAVSSICKHQYHAGKCCAWCLFCCSFKPLFKNTPCTATWL